MNTQHVVRCGAAAARKTSTEMKRRSLSRGLLPKHSITHHHCSSINCNCTSHRFYSSTAVSTKGYVIKEEPIDNIFADRKNYLGKYEVHDTDDVENLPTHLNKTLKSKRMQHFLYGDTPPVPKNESINPHDYMTEDIDQLKAEGVRTTVEDPDYYKKYNHRQTADILSQGIQIEMPVIPQVVPDKPFEQMSADEFKSYASEHMSRRLMASQVKIPKPRMDKDGKMRKTIMNASNKEIDMLLRTSEKEKDNVKELLKNKKLDNAAQTEWEAVLSLEDQLKRLIADEDKVYEPVRPERPSAKKVVTAFLALLLMANCVLALTTPGVRALVLRPLVEQIQNLTGKKPKQAAVAQQ
eukprot:CAMPEP_0117451068 /NCGR_PEP_ID=MMETSP0759-20121206/8807_1 /TAXON_ID=63605 /ORGANISM="Percolomonas cosmopolitus, Strain WS" /LENGTH=351 /DNA_ID=CAMNT_0005243637 /DNA_START=98 /DNA_END=1153 /DNA_ORIENTATION=-